MSIETFSTFYYGHAIDGDNYRLDFDEGAAELTAELEFGEYTLTEFIDEVERALNEAGALTYTVTVNRSTRIVTVAASGNFTLRVTTGTNAMISAYSLMGFTVNKTGAATYASDTTTGSSYTPQFKLQEYVDPDHYQKPIQSTVHEAANGDVEVVRFGVLRMMEMNIRFCTNIGQPSGGPITNNATGVEDVVALLNYLVTKAPVEFMPDSTDTATYLKVLLDSTQANDKGCGYKLKERVDLAIPGYYDTQLLTFRVIE